jgi:phage recombination protein Bet
MSNLPAVQSERFTQDEIALLRNTYAKGLSDSETSLFLKQAEAMNLNPFTKEIYGMVVSDRLVLITSIAGLRKIAHASGSYLGCKVDTEMDGKSPVSAKATVKKLVQGHVAEFEAEVAFAEYNTGKSQWAKMPITMLKKVAEAHALRMAYPAAENLYDESEIGAIKRAPKESGRAQELTAKFQEQPQREVVAHPDTHEDLPITLASEPVVVEKSVDQAHTPGEYVIQVGKNTGKRLKDLERKDIEQFCKWAYSQETLSDKTAEYLNNAEAYLAD